MKKQTVIRELALLANSYVLSNTIRKKIKEAIDMLKNQDLLIEELDKQKKEIEQLRDELKRVKDFYEYGRKMGYNKDIGDYPNEMWSSSDISKLCSLEEYEIEAQENPLIGIEK